MTLGRAMLNATRAVALMILHLAHTAQAQLLPPDVEGRMKLLRAQWPEVGTAVLADGERFEYRDGAIRVGEETLVHLDALEDKATVLDFLLAHEAWHSVQFKQRTFAEVGRMRVTKMLECEADFMGAAAAYRLTSARAIPQAHLEAARVAVEYFVRGSPVDGGDSSTYPSPDLRAVTIGLGWAHAASVTAISAGSEGIPWTEPEHSKAYQVCQRISGISDGAAGNLNIFYDSILSQEVGGKRGHLADLTFQNYSARPILAGIMALGKRHWRTPLNLEMPAKSSSTTYAAVLDDVLVPAQSKVTRRYFIPDDLRESQTDDFSVATFPFTWGNDGNGLLTARYADGALPNAAELGVDHGFCYPNIARSKKTADRALLTRLATIALAAPESFRPLASDQFVDQFGARRVSLIGGLSRTKDDHITLNATAPPTVHISAFSSDDEKTVRAEFARLKSLFYEVCGQTAIVEHASGPAEPKGDQSISTTRFAPGAYVAMNITLWSNVRDIEVLRPDEKLKGGLISITIARHLDW